MFTSAMKTSSYSRTFACAFVLTLAGVSTTAVAESVTVYEGTPSITVPYSDLDLETAAGNRTLYARLSSAARRVCPRIDNRDLATKAAVQQCRERALARAVHAIDSPALAALHRQSGVAT
jgi:UrcA family protein